jgi:ABC-type transport system involved in multi-copper enzyme maturation permease subunit
MTALVRVAVIAQNTLREAVRNKLLYNLLLFAVLMILSSIALAELHVGYRVRIYRDVGLSAIALFGSLIAIFVGINLVNREIAQKTVYTILAKPVRRWEFLVGKYLGLVSLLVLQVAVMALCFLSVLALNNAEISVSLLQAIGMIAMELVLLTAVALFFSSFTTPYLAGMFTVALWVIGHLLADLRAFGDSSEVPALQAATEALYWTLPNLDRLDFKSEAAATHAIDAMRVALAALYGMLYSIALLVASVWFFRRRDFA